MSENKTIAIIGASNDRTKYGNAAVQAYKAQGYTVYPVNPNESEIEGLKCYPSILDIPGEVEIASLYLPPDKTCHVLEGIARKGVDEVFLNPGSSDERVTARAEELGLNSVEACSIVAVGRKPGEFMESG